MPHNCRTRLGLDTRATAMQPGVSRVQPANSMLRRLMTTSLTAPPQTMSLQLHIALVQAHVANLRQAAVVNCLAPREARHKHARCLRPSAASRLARSVGRWPRPHRRSPSSPDHLNPRSPTPFVQRPPVTFPSPWVLTTAPARTPRKPSSASLASCHTINLTIRPRKRSLALTDDAGVNGYLLHTSQRRG
jgi:hypothetical protein